MGAGVYKQPRQQLMGRAQKEYPNGKLCKNRGNLPGNSLNIPPSRWKSPPVFLHNQPGNCRRAQSLDVPADASCHSNRPCPKQYSATLGSLRWGITPLELADGASTIANLVFQLIRRR